MSAWPYNTARWQRLRARHLAMSPLCVDCEAIGLLVPATHVDHLDPPRLGGAPFPAHDRLRSRCHACHSAKTARSAEHGAVQSTKPRKGCDANGNPLDPSHPWAVQVGGPKGERGASPAKTGAGGRTTWGPTDSISSGEYH